MSIVIGNQLFRVPGVVSVSFKDDPRRVPEVTDFYPRTTWIRGIVLHTVHGTTGRLAHGEVDSGRDFTYATYQARTARHVSWDATVDTDGSVTWSNDPLKRATWHAGSVNPYTIGIELVQERDGTLYDKQLEKVVKLLDFLTITLGIQRQIPAVNGRPFGGIIERCTSAGGAGSTVCGIYGHRNQTRDRGFGDPGNHIFEALLAHGYEGFDFNAHQDRDVWRRRQAEAGIARAQVDGVPGPATRRALLARGKPGGVWVQFGPSTAAVVATLLGLAGIGAAALSGRFA